MNAEQTIAWFVNQARIDRAINAVLAEATEEN